MMLGTRWVPRILTRSLSSPMHRLHPGHSEHNSEKQRQGSWHRGPQHQMGERKLTDEKEAQVEVSAMAGKEEGKHGRGRSSREDRQASVRSTCEQRPGGGVEDCCSEPGKKSAASRSSTEAGRQGGDAREAREARAQQAGRKWSRREQEGRQGPAHRATGAQGRGLPSH